MAQLNNYLNSISRSIRQYDGELLFMIAYRDSETIAKFTCGLQYKIVAVWTSFDLYLTAFL